MSKARDIGDSAATINYIDTLSSNAQTQLDGKADLSGSPTFTGGVTIDDDNNYSFGDGTTYIQGSGAADRLKFITNASEAMRIDSSGNLLVATTDADTQNNNAGSSADNGLVYNIGSGGYFNVARYNGTVGYFNRTGTEGDIVQFRFGGTTVGSIGVDNSDNIFLEGVSGGLQVATDTLLPHKNGATADGQIDLGASGNRWKDLYLSGTAKVNAVTYTGTDGTAGQVLTTDGSGNATFADAGGGAIELISTTTVSGTPSTIDITSGFSSTYDNYFIYADDVTLSSSNSFNMRVYKSASLLTSSDYSYTTRTGSSQFSQTSFEIAYYESTAGSAGFRVEIVNVNSSAFAISSNSLFRAVINGYNTSGSGSVTGVRIFPASGNFTAGSFRLYGVKKS